MEVKKHDFFYNRIRYLIGVKSGITYVISHNYAEIKVNSYNSLPLEKMLTCHNVIILVNSVWNKDKKNFYYVCMNYLKIPIFFCFFKL